MTTIIESQPAQLSVCVGLTSFFLYRGYVPWRHLHKPYSDRQLAWRTRFLHLNETRMPRNFKYLIVSVIVGAHLVDKQKRS